MNNLKIIITLWFLSFVLFIPANFAQIVIKMKKESGVYTIPCKVNGLSLTFILDTGSSDVSISLTEAIFMVKNGYLNPEDIRGTSYARFANGEVAENTDIMIREIEINGYKLKNIKATVVHTMKAPLLLGQSALEKLGSIQINGDQLIIYQRPNGSQNDEPYSEGIHNWNQPEEYNQFNTNNDSLSGTQRVYLNADIYDSPDLKNSKVIGKVKSGVVTIIEKTNEMFYKISSGETTGYLWVGSFKKQE
jgi:clan AA aspartic protease (TIGR02281 family)